MRAPHCCGAGYSDGGGGGGGVEETVVVRANRNTCGMSEFVLQMPGWAPKSEARSATSCLNRRYFVLDSPENMHPHIVVMVVTVFFWGGISK